MNSRTDDNEALFVSLLEPHNRLEIAGVEIMLRKLGRSLEINKVHPHKFRRTLAPVQLILEDDERLDMEEDLKIKLFADWSDRELFEK